MTQNTSMESHELSERFKELQSQSQVVNKLVRVTKMPLFLPHSFHTSEDRYGVVADSFTRMWKPEGAKDVPLPYPLSGVLCANQELLKEIAELNSRKKLFKDCVVKIQKSYAASNVKFNLAEKLNLAPELKELFLRKGLGSLCRTSCYRQIKVLPANLKSVRWTWAVKAKGVEKLRVSAVLKSIEHGTAPHIVVARDLLSKLDPNMWIAEVKTRTPKLMANLVYLNEEGCVRKPIACSGVMVVPEDKLPSILSWMDKPSDEEVKARIFKTFGKTNIEPNAFITELKLHHYKPGCEPKREII